MNIRKLIEYVHEEAEGEPSRQDQVRVLVVMSQYGYQRSGALKQREIADHADALNIEFDHKIGTALSNLVDHDVLDRFRPAGPDWYVISQRTDDIINGEFEETLRTEREALIDHIQHEDPEDEGEAHAAADGGTPLRDVVARALGVVPDGVEDHLRGGEPREQRERLNTAVEAVEEHPHFEKQGYDKIILKPSAYRYHFSAMVLALIEGVGYDREP